MSQDENVKPFELWTEDEKIDAWVRISNAIGRPRDGCFPCREWTREDVIAESEKMKEQAAIPSSVTVGKVTEYRRIMPDDPLNVSYSLPIGESELRETDQTLVTQWTARFLDKRPDEIKNMLADEWLSFRGVVRSFADFLLEYTPCAVVSDSQALWLSLASQEEDPVHLTFREPVELDEDQRQFLAQFDAPGLEMFCRYFTELSLAPNADNVMLEFKARPVTLDELWNCGDKLVGGIAIFREPSGDQMILTKDGKVWKWAHELTYKGPEEAVKEGFADFPSFILTFIEMMKGSDKAWDAFKFYS